MVFLGHGPDERPHLWVHSLDSMTTRLLPGIKHPALPFWSPDTRLVARLEEREIEYAVTGDGQSYLWGAGGSQ